MISEQVGMKEVENIWRIPWAIAILGIEHKTLEFKVVCKDLMWEVSAWKQQELFVDRAQENTSSL